MDIMDVCRGHFEKVPMKSLHFVQQSTCLPCGGMKPVEMVLFKVMWSVFNTKIVPRSTTDFLLIETFCISHLVQYFVIKLYVLMSHQVSLLLYYFVISSLSVDFSKCEFNILVINLLNRMW